MANAVSTAQRIVEARRFELGIIVLILINAVILGMATSSSLVDRYGDAFETASRIILGAFVVEALLKMAARWPRPHRYFRDGWNVFDFLVILVALLPATGTFAMAARLGRLMRLMRLVTAMRELRIVVGTLLRSLPSVANVTVLMLIVIYIYAVVGYHLFHETDPAQWGSLGLSALTLFEMVTMEGWTVFLDTAMEEHPWAWVYFVSFILIGTFVVANVVIAVVVNNLDEVKSEQVRSLQSPPTADDLLREIRATQESLRRLEEQLQRRPPDGE